MLYLFRCVIALICILFVFSVWGTYMSEKLGVRKKQFPLYILVGCFSYFCVMEVVILPIIFLYNKLFFATLCVVIISVVPTIFMFYKSRKDWVEKLIDFLRKPMNLLMILAVALMALVAVLQQYSGYDMTYYIGEMNSFLYYGEFWTRDAFLGLSETNNIPLHYALSCFYPICAVWANIFHIEARLMALYTVRALCVVLFGCVAYTWGYSLLKIEKEKRMENGALFCVLCMTLGFFLVDYHSLMYMMIVRGYESKGFCAAVVAPMCVYSLVQLCQDINDMSSWRLLGLVAWSSMPIAMSSMAIIPVAIGITGIALMVCNKQIGSILRNCFLCVLPNMLLMSWYVLDKFLPGMKG